MGHNHDHHTHHHPNQSDNGSNILVALILNSLFVIVELIGGFLTNSMAIISDAVHDLGDSLSLGLSYYFHKKSAKKRDQQYNYGYRRFGLLGAFINSMVLIVSSVFIIQQSVKRLFDPVEPDATGMLFLAVLGIVVNGVAMLRLQRGHSLNEKAVSLHLLEDVLGWVAVLIGSIVMHFYDVPLLDPILSLAIAAFILWNVYKTLRSTLKIFLQQKPESVNEEEVTRQLLEIPGVTGIHDMHFWTLDGQHHVVTLHVVISVQTSASELEKIKSEVRHTLHHLLIEHATIEMEYDGAQCNRSESAIIQK
ncbi:MAG TPA: cation diffusion facilitator family transporter [Chryseosolibacter sp.]|nr:cation diffusion facilitator family transporter [Chryseosolibacter sp.]